jgi:hypothetical protein
MAHQLIFDEASQLEDKKAKGLKSDGVTKDHKSIYFRLIGKASSYKMRLFERLQFNKFKSEVYAVSLILAA